MQQKTSALRTGLDDWAIPVSRMNTQDKQYIWLTLTIVCLIIACMRSFTFAGHTPLLGLANNYDMLRLQSCHQIWPTDPQFPPAIQSPGAPLEHYFVDSSVRAGACILSSELLFTYIGEGIVRIKSALTGDNTFSIRIFSYLRAVFLILSVTWISFRLAKYKQYRTACLNAMFAASVLTDPGVLIYLPTFYTEFSAVMGIYLAITAWYTYTLRQEKNLLLLCLFGFALLGLSKFQHMLLPLTLVIGFVLPLLVWRKKLPASTSVLLVCIACVLLLVQVARMSVGQNYTINLANLTDTVMYTFVARAKDPMHALKQLGLPEHCAPAIGRSFFTQERPIETFCPEIAKVSRLAVLGLYLSDSVMFQHTNRDALQQLRPWLPGYLGQVQQQHWGVLSNHVFTVSSWLDQIKSLPIFTLFVLSPLVLSLMLFMCMKFICMKSVDKLNFGIITVLFTTQLGALEIFFVSLFGDGLADFSKHCHLLLVLVLAGYAILSGYLYEYLSLCWYRVQADRNRQYARINSSFVTGYRLENIRVQGNDSSRETSIDFQSDLVISGHIITPDDCPPVIGIGFVRTGDILIYGSISAIEGLTPNPLETGRYGFRFVAQQLPLLPGEYTIYLHAMDSEGLHIYDTYERALLIRGQSRESGMCRFPHQWEIFSELIDAQ